MSDALKGFGTAAAGIAKWIARYGYENVILLY